MGRFLLLFCAILGTGVTGTVNLRAESEPVEITRVKIEQYLASKPVRTEDPMIRFERRYLVWGAIGSDEYREREGKYFSIFWKMREVSGGVTVRFEYLQGKTGRTVQVQEVFVDRPKRGNNVVDLQVTGAAFHENGDVLAWKASVLQGGVVMAERRSFLWKDQ